MKYLYSTSCSKSRLREIRAFTEGVLRKHDMDELEISTIVLAVDEVCANLIIHGHECDDSDELQLEIDIHSDKVIFDIIDRSEMFNINKYKAPQLEDIIKMQRKGGLGLILVKKIMDEIKIFPKGEFYVCQLTKKIA
ncbi:ATP-binding protein [Fulvivirga sedimenti]|uniref:ATP-binding protein n=1 Tax=Fulvivirga sedimenti TaxID=2879465 RepID=A0A9X1HWD7_9BACT|nr:ATP-binding protein [Fulvivirga sedimenti]MCA6078278.1 ATP-binding protein [Fulvivirga sedimenti]